MGQQKQQRHGGKHWLGQHLRRTWQRLNRTSRRICLVLVGLGLLCLVIRSLPYLAPVRAQDLRQDQQAVEFSDRNGLTLGTILTRDQNHTAVVPLNQVSPHFIQAILAAEDGRFYRHGVLEMRSIARSVREAAIVGRFRSGASTITMQLARMIQPVPSNPSGKGREVWLAWRIGAGMGKDDILQSYINRLPMGGNIYGVEAAARVYFGVPARDLNLAQASLLAALPNDPTYLNPYDYWYALKERQFYVLDRMVKDGYIDRDQADRAYAERVKFQARQQGIIAAPHFLFWLAQQLPASHPSQIRTTIDRPLQQFVESQVQQVVRTLAPNNVHHAAALVIDNHTGEILSYVGSPNYFEELAGGRNDGVQALRQPGSTLKPFLYELALETRTLRPNTILADVPTRYGIPGAKLYSPTDYTETFQGPVRVRIALANSLNIPAVRVLERLGVPNLLDRLHQLGFRHLNRPPAYYGLGLTLGSGEVSLWELASAYVTMAKQGQGLPLIPYRGAGVPGQPAAIGSASTWALITDMLSDRHARAKAFGVESVLSLPFPTAVKTGTSSDFRDTWTVGFSTDYTVATWIGNFSGDPMRQVSGVTGAAPLWNRIMLHLHEQQEPGSFPPPAGMVQRPICALSGMRPTPACPIVVQEYLYTQDLAAYATQPDPFYIAVRGADGQPQYRLNLPPEYNEWLATQPQSTLVTGGLRIVAPRNGDFFLTTAQQTQTLEFKLASQPSQAVEWWLNGRKLASQATSSLFWSLRPGEWVLEAKSGDMTDRVRFQVELAENKPNRRGFSIANP